MWILSVAAERVILSGLVMLAGYGIAIAAVYFFIVSAVKRGVQAAQREAEGGHISRMDHVLAYLKARLRRS
jgi:cytochrome bd-type quinol oxidase subunit 1